MSKHAMKKSVYLSVIAVLSLPIFVFGHCDTLTRPVVMDARKALESGTVTPVLKWIKEEYEPEISRAFQKVREVRQLNSSARELADYYFFETVVRLHRAGEGAAYSGISDEVFPAVIVEADKAMNTGSIEVLLKMITSDVEGNLRQKFDEVIAKKKNANDSVKAGREYVKAYVEFVHYLEGLDRMGQGEKHSH